MRWLPVLIFWAILYAVGASNLPAALQASDRWLQNTPERLPNVRTVADRCQLPYVDRFVALHDWSQPTLLLLGDSQVFANSLDDHETWGHVLAADLGLEPLNLSVIDGRPGDTEQVVARVLAAGVTPALTIVDLNRAHLSLEQRDFRYVQGRAVLPWDYMICAFEMRRRLIETNMVLPSNGVPATTYQHIALSPAYLSADQSVITQLVPTFLNSVASIPGPSAAYVVPNNRDRFVDHEFDLTRYKASGQVIEATCQASRIDLCLGEPTTLTDGDYIDIVHLNPLGNRKFADLLALRLRAFAPG